ncbi:hypothetical protein AK830_g12569 [Neonectria ditissima]|uniref:Uncharacterized protein n=1 Tax=Neonectria ditissima TaxID=78410 RepID=A0A0P7AAJ4_9HYPO|nr:hypothetical protein AK830_g12569 [Neonectria ditissima]
MDPLAESRDAGTQTTANPLMPPAKQQRILIWRTEVASALSLPAPSLASSHSDESADSSSSAAASPGPGPSSPSRPRGFWKRLSWRFSSRYRDDPAASPDAERTSMYREDRPRKGTGSHHVDDDDNDDDEGALPDKISDDGAGNGNGLRDKQERLQRAARLLNKGIREDEGATAIKAHRSRNRQHSLA